MPTALILYATGTGNSWHAAEVISGRLMKAGWTSTTRELRAGVELPRGKLSEDLIILVFPVLGFGIPPGLPRLLRGMRARSGSRVPAAVFSTWGGHPGAALRQARWLLRRRGFKVIAAAGTAYPFNWTQVFNPPSGQDAGGIVMKGDHAAERFADGLVTVLADAATMPSARLPVTDVLWLPIAWLYKWTGAKGMAGMYGADERCTACGICARDCPAAAIRMSGKGSKRRPRWNTRCWACNRCINTCPESAIQMSPLRTATMLLINILLLAALVLGLNRLAALAAQPPWITVPLWILAFLGVGVLLTHLQLVALDPLFFALEGIPGLRKLVGKSWTKGYRRYRCQGFKPAARR